MTGMELYFQTEERGYYMFLPVIMDNKPVAKYLN